MNNIKVLKTGINVSKILKQLEQYPEDWGAHRNLAGDLIWFNNKLEHGTENLGDCVRITFVFDIPH